MTKTFPHPTGIMNAKSGLGELITQAREEKAVRFINPNGSIKGSSFKPIKSNT